MPEEQVFDESVENLLRPYRKKMTPAAARRLAELGVDLNARLKPAYPRKVQDEMIRLLAEEFHPGLDMEKAAYEVGASAIKVLQEGIMGKTLMRVLKMLPHKAGLKRLPKIFRIGNNFLDVSVHETGELSYELHFNELGAWPYYWVGLMDTANKLLFGYPRSIVQVRKYDGHAGVIHVDLEPPK